MRKLMMKMSVSLDGFVADANGEGDWVFKSSDSESKALVLEWFREAGLIIMGRKSFEAMSSYWPGAEGPFAGPMNETPKALFTTQSSYRVALSAPASPGTRSWAEARVYSGDLAEEIRRLKQESGKPILAIGGAGFMRSLIATGLIDEYHLPIHPTALGSGLRIFDGLAKPIDLKLTSTKVFPGGIVAPTYHPV